MLGSWTQTIDAAALCVTALALLSGAVALVRIRQLGPALAVLMEMLTGAGLLHLAAAPTLNRALGAGGVLLIRKLAILRLKEDPLAALLVHLRRVSVRLTTRRYWHPAPHARGFRRDRR